MAEKNIKSRIVHKHDIAENWAKATSFVPLKGEVIVYDIDDNYNYERFKIGDGQTVVGLLPFFDDALKAEIEELGAVASIQSDWNQNDETASDYIKNRTHWVESELITSPYLSSLTTRAGVMEVSVGTPIWEGEKYIVTIDGVRYASRAYCTEDWCAALGDSRLYNPDDMSNPVDLPFFITINEEEGESFDSPWGTEVTYIYVADIRFTDSEEHTVEIAVITGDNSTYHTLDENFIPDTIARKSDVEDYVATKIPEIVNASAIGKNVEGETFEVGGTTYTAEAGAQIFNSLEGKDQNIAIGKNSHAEGLATKANGEYSHAEGHYTDANGNGSHAEGYSADAIGTCSHAEGEHTTATGEASHAEGYNTKANGEYSHAEGHYTDANGEGSHAEGAHTTATGMASHAEGYGTIASFDNQHVQGKFNIEDTTGAYAHIVGNGSYGTPSNAHTLDWDGNAWFQGDVYVGGTSQDDGSKLATESQIPTKLTNLENDLFYKDKKEHFLTLTKNDFETWETPAQQHEFLYTSSPKLDWFTSAEDIYWEINASIDGEAFTMTSADATEVYFMKDPTDDGKTKITYEGNFPFYISSGSDYKYWDECLSKDEFVVGWMMNDEHWDEVNLTIYKIVSKQLSGEYIEDMYYTSPDNEVHQIPEKYLPIMEEVPGVIFEHDCIPSYGWTLEGAEYKELIGQYEVIIDDNSEIVEFIHNFDYSYANGSFFNIETWDGGIWFDISESQTARIVVAHTVKIIGSVYKVAEKYLPSSATDFVQSDWNQTDETQSDYIKNKPNVHSIIVSEAPPTATTEGAYGQIYISSPNYQGGIDEVYICYGTEYNDGVVTYKWMKVQYDISSTINKINNNILDIQDAIGEDDYEGTLFERVAALEEGEGGSVDVSDKMDKVVDGKSGNFIKLDTDGNAVDSGYNSNSFVPIASLTGLIIPHINNNDIHWTTDEINALIDAKIATIPNAEEASF